MTPRRVCYLRAQRLARVHDYLLLEKEFVARCTAKKPLDARRREERRIVNALRGSPMSMAKIHELFEDEKVWGRERGGGEQHAVVVIDGSKREWYVPILSIVDRVGEERGERRGAGSTATERPCPGQGGRQFQDDTLRRGRGPARRGRRQALDLQSGQGP